MGRPVVDRIGQRYGKLVVIGRAEDGIRKSNGQILPRWICQCDCGNIKVVGGGSLQSGNVQSCGCLNKITDNITGQKFGKLTVGDMFHKNNRAYYHCTCDCGNKVDVNRYDLIYGRRTHCGKCEIVRHPNRLVDLTGNRYGRLTVIKRVEDRFTSGGNRLYMWQCQCDCGRIVEVPRNALVNGKTTSCGCYQAEKFGMAMEEYEEKFFNVKKNSTGIFQDLTGMRFGKLVIRERALNSKHGRVQWVCDCDCGGVVTVTAANLKSGHTQSCGCIDSVGETMIANYLSKAGVRYRKEKTFSDCRDKYPLPFDFGLKKDTEEVVALVEYDGIQHFKPVRFNGMREEDVLVNFEKTKRHDKIKNDYCKEHNIPLLRIKYDEKDNLEDMLDSFLKEVIFDE